MAEEIHLRHCIFYEFQLGTDFKTATKNIKKSLGDNAIDEIRCRKWYNKFCNGHFSLDDNSDDEEEENLHNCIKIKHLSTIQKERAIAFYQSMQYYVNTIGVFNFHNQRRKIAQYLSTLFENKAILRNIVVLDELCVSYFTLQKVNVNEGTPYLPEWKICTKLNTSIISFWWNFRGFLHFEPLPKYKILTNEFYSKQVDKLHEILLLKEPAPILSKRVLLQHDIDRLYTTEILAKLNKLGFFIIPQPLNSPDFNSSSFCLLPDLKKRFENKLFASEELLMLSIIDFLDCQKEEFYSNGIKNLKNVWKDVYLNYGQHSMQ